MRSCHSTNSAAQARRLCYFSLGVRHPGGAERSRAYCIIGVPPVFPICAKGDDQKLESQTLQRSQSQMRSCHSTNSAAQAGRRSVSLPRLMSDAAIWRVRLKLEGQVKADRAAATRPSNA